MTRLRRDAEEVREVGEREAPAPPVQEPAREPDGVEDRRGHAPAGHALDLPLEEAHVEARVVRDERRVAGEGEEAPNRDLGARCPPQVGLADSGEGGDEGRERGARIDQRLERVDDLEAANANGADLADPVAGRRESRRLQVEDDELGVLDRDLCVRLACETDPRAEPGEPGVAVDDVGEQRASERRGSALEREQDARRLLHAHRRPPRLHELDQAIGGVEGELHRSRP